MLIYTLTAEPCFGVTDQAKLIGVYRTLKEGMTKLSELLPKCIESDMSWELVEWGIGEQDLFPNPRRNGTKLRRWVAGKPV